MSMARNLERRLERLVDGLAARLFGGSVNPTELGTMLLREADLGVVEAPAGPTAPNVYVVTVPGALAEPTAAPTVEAELAELVEAAALDQGWRLDGPVVVEITAAAGQTGSPTIGTDRRPGPRLAWAELDGGDGDTLPIAVNRAVIGRSGEVDIHVPGAEVSRRHAMVWREAGRTWLADLGSSNGTYLNGGLLEGPVELVDGDGITFGAPSFRFRTI